MDGYQKNTNDEYPKLVDRVITKKCPTQLVGWEKLDIFQTRITC